MKVVHSSLFRAVCAIIIGVLLIQYTIKGRFDEALVATFCKKQQHNINM